MQLILKTSTINTTLKAGRKIEYIVVHYTAGVTSKSGSALNTTNYYKTTKNVSADYTVDDTTVAQYNPDIKNRYCWHCGGSFYNNKGGGFFGKCTNKNSIGVEICCTNSTGKMQTANDRSYSFTEAALNNAAELVKFLMKEYDIPADRVIRHYDVTGKPCPGIIGWNLESGSEAEWLKFKSRIGDCSSAASSAKYYVQVGAFAKEENADRYLESVKKKYPEAFIKIVHYINVDEPMYFVQVGAFSDKANAEKFLRSVQIHFPKAFIKEM